MAMYGYFLADFSYLYHIIARKTGQKNGKQLDREGEKKRRAHVVMVCYDYFDGEHS